MKYINFLNFNYSKMNIKIIKNHVFYNGFIYNIFDRKTDFYIIVGDFSITF